MNLPALTLPPEIVLTHGGDGVKELGRTLIDAGLMQHRHLRKSPAEAVMAVFAEHAGPLLKLRYFRSAGFNVTEQDGMMEDGRAYASHTERNDKVPLAGVRFISHPDELLIGTLEPRLETLDRHAEKIGALVLGMLADADRVSGNWMLLPSWYYGCVEGYHWNGHSDEGAALEEAIDGCYTTAGKGNMTQHRLCKNLDPDLRALLETPEAARDDTWHHQICRHFNIPMQSDLDAVAPWWAWQPCPNAKAHKALRKLLRTPPPRSWPKEAKRLHTLCADLNHAIASLPLRTGIDHPWPDSPKHRCRWLHDLNHFEQTTEMAAPLLLRWSDEDDMTTMWDQAMNDAYQASDEIQMASAILFPRTDPLAARAAFRRLRDMARILSLTDQILDLIITIEP